MLAERALDSLNANYLGDSLAAIIAYHPYPYDRLNINPDDSIRLAGHPHQSGQPEAILDGYNQITMPSEARLYYETFRNAVTVVRSESTYVTIAASGRYDSTGGEVTVTVTVDSLVPGQEPALFCVLTEDDLEGALGGRFDRVAREFLTGTEGKPIQVARWDTLYDTLRFELGERAPANLKAAVFVEDLAERRVMQSFQITEFTPKEER